MTPPSDNSPPAIAGPSPYLLPHDVIYTAPNSSLVLSLSLTDQDTVMGVAFRPLAPQPEGVTVEGPTVRGGNMAEVLIRWLPMEAQLGTHMLCYEAVDYQGAKSPPTCLIVMVAEEYMEVS